MVKTRYYRSHSQAWCGHNTSPHPDRKICTPYFKIPLKPIPSRITDRRIRGRVERHKGRENEEKTRRKMNIKNERKRSNDP